MSGTVQTRPAPAPASSAFDVVVVGGGGSGLIAALAAARAGARVIVLEKQHRFGGTTRLSVGSISASSTRLQRRAGVADDPQAHFEDMEKFHTARHAGRDNEELRRLLVDTIPAAIELLEEIGVEFVGPFPEGAHRCPRLHAIVPHARGYVDRLLGACRAAGVGLWASASVADLVQEGGSVVGVKVDTDGRREVIRARRAVILAAGDFSSASSDFKARFLPDRLLHIDGINCASSGDGQRLGLAMGGTVVNGDLALGPEIRFVAPPRPRLLARIPSWPFLARGIAWATRRLPDRMLRPLLMSYVTTFLAPSHRLFEAGAILVNREGRRFCDERANPEEALGGQPGQETFVVMDSRLAGTFSRWPNFISTAPGVGYAYLPDYMRSRRDICFTASNPAELAVRMGVPATNLQTTLASLSEARERAGLPAFGAGPFVAIGPARPWIVFTEGGLHVDSRLRILDGAGWPIPGLFAAGSTGQGGLLLEGHGHHLGWAFASGLVAGRNAAWAGDAG